jgi:hypothetical protein
MLAVLLTLLAAWLFGICLGFALGKRSCLPFGRPLSFVETLLEIANGLL